MATYILQPRVNQFEIQFEPRHLNLEIRHPFIGLNLGALEFMNPAISSRHYGTIQVLQLPINLKSMEMVVLTASGLAEI